MQKEFRETVSQLENIYEPNEAKNIASLLFEDITGLTQSRIFMTDSSLTVKQKEQLKYEIERLLKNEPIQYILSKAWFYGREFYVNTNVLIPRPETEELVAWVLESLPSDNLKILDIGTGSGCIPITVELETAHNNVHALDVSTKALAIAKRNSEKLSGKVNFHEANILDWENHTSIQTNWDIIISNPPYIRKEEALQMRKNVLDYEPHLALFVENNSPLIFYERICDFAVQFLDTNGSLFFEINEAFGEKTDNLLKTKGFKKSIIKEDLFGRKRMIKAQR